MHICPRCYGMDTLHLSIRAYVNGHIDATCTKCGLNARFWATARSFPWRVFNSETTKCKMEFFGPESYFEQRRIKNRTFCGANESFVLELRGLTEPFLL